MFVRVFGRRRRRRVGLWVYGMSVADIASYAAPMGFVAYVREKRVYARVSCNSNQLHFV